MKEIVEIINMAKNGDHPSCKNCSRNPKVQDTAFASCCSDHYGYNKNGLVIILRDPGANDGGAAHTGRICPIHNNDKTAKILRTNLKTIQIPNESIYFLNSILHGFFDTNSKKNNNIERECCLSILSEIISLIEPKIILAMGLEALQTTLDILNNTNVRKPTLKGMIENSFSYGEISGVNVFSMPHPAYAKTNLGKNGIKESDVWQSISQKINKIWINTD
jgi:uracil-DNA glycosylase family 4